MVLQVEAIVIRWLNVLDMVQLAPQIDVKSTMFYRLPALAEVRTGSVNTQADDASFLNQPTAFHEESLGLCSNIISGRLMSKKRFHTLQLPPQPQGSEGSLYHGQRPELRRLSQDLKSPKHNLNLRNGDKVQHDPTSMSILRILSQI